MIISATSRASALSYGPVGMGLRRRILHTPYRRIHTVYCICSKTAYFYAFHLLRFYALIFARATFLLGFTM